MNGSPHINTWFLSAPLAIDDAVKILDNWKNKKFGDGVVSAHYLVFCVIHWDLIYHLLLGEFWSEVLREFLITLFCDLESC